MNKCKICGQEYQDAHEHVKTVAHPIKEMEKWTEGYCPICGAKIHWLPLGNPEAPSTEASCPNCDLVFYEY